MPDHQGSFCWYDFVTTDPKAALDFYSAALGWVGHPSGNPAGKPYTLLRAGTVDIGGIVGLDPGEGGGGPWPGWGGYIAVTDINAMAARVREAGGMVHHGPAPIPGIGRFAAVSDPTRAVFFLFQPDDPAMGPPPPEGPEPGRIGWHELHTTDATAALGFYESLFGWTKAEAIDMGPAGPYQLFATGGPPVGAVMKDPGAADRPYWLFYVNVPEIHAAIGRITAAGGTILHGPAEVPGGSWIALARDKQGARFAVVAPDPG